MSYLDHCIETTWTPVTKDFGGGIIRTEHYTADEELPEWLGEAAELRLSPKLGETGGGILFVELVGAGDEAHAGFRNKSRGEIMPVLRINGVWGRINSIYDSRTPDINNYNIYVTAEEHTEILEYDGSVLEEEVPRPLSKRAVWANAGRAPYDHKWTHGQKTRWGQEADTYSHWQRAISSSQTQEDVNETILARYERWLKNPETEEEKKKLEAAIAEKEAYLAHFAKAIPEYKLKYAQSLAKLEKWESGEDPDPNLAKIEALQPGLRKLTARRERYQEILEQIGPDHDQYPLGVQLIADLDVQIGKIEAEIATLSK